MYQGLSSEEWGNSLGSLHLLCDMKYLLAWSMWLFLCVLKFIKRGLDGCILVPQVYLKQFLLTVGVQVPPVTLIDIAIIILFFLLCMLLSVNLVVKIKAATYSSTWMFTVRQ
jgi:hypothetical protein